ncbi:MAG: transketolase [Candidatus Pacebacteria bacterium]|nr:transketolase [Candidatus Paceibacterota bacterium]
MTHITEQEIAHVEHMARRVRVSVVDMLATAGSGHLAGSLGMADIFSALYFYILRHDPSDPEWEERDRLILSNGHIVPVRYATMAHAGYFPLEELATLRRLGSRLQGHPERTRLSGLETTSGPLGEGLSQAVGITLGACMDGKEFRTFCVTSDGEHQCGITWEAIMCAGAKKLHNLINIVDRNGIQIGGATEDVMPVEPLMEKYEAFGWHVIDVDGHNIEMFCDAVATAHDITDRPTVIIAHTIPGKGVPEIEGDYRWHGKVPTKEEAERWIATLQ